MLIIGERLNSSRNSIEKAIRSRDVGFIQAEAEAQAQAGAHYLDVNAGVFVGEEAECLKWLVIAVQGVTDLPLCIDSPDPEVVKSVLPLVGKTPMINSITLEPSRLEGLIPLVKDHGTKVIGLCQSEDRMAETADQKTEMAGRLAEKVAAAGIPLDHLYIDPLVYPLGADYKSAQATLDAIDRIMAEFPGVHTTCGLTNVSHGLPNRRLINRTFLIMAMTRGLDSAILDPCDRQLYGSLKAATVLAGQDDFCMEYVTAFREGRLA